MFALSSAETSTLGTPSKQHENTRNRSADPTDARAGERRAASLRAQPQLYPAAAGSRASVRHTHNSADHRQARDRHLPNRSDVRGRSRVGVSKR